MWNFKGYLWNSAQNIIPIHWKMRILFSGENLGALNFKSSYVFMKRLTEPSRKTHSSYRNMKCHSCFSSMHYITFSLKLSGNLRSRPSLHLNKMQTTFSNGFSLLDNFFYSNCLDGCSCGPVGNMATRWVFDVWNSFLYIPCQMT